MALVVNLLTKKIVKMSILVWSHNKLTKSVLYNPLFNPWSLFL